MKAPTQGDRSRWEILVPGLILVAPLLGFLSYSTYGLLLPEAMLCILGSVGVGCLAGLVIHHSSDPVRVLILAGCLTLFVDLQFDGAHSLGAGALALVALGGTASVWLMRSRIMIILPVTFASLVVLIGVFPERLPLLRTEGEERPAVLEAGRDPVLVLLLDEHAGVEGIPTDIEGGSEVRRRVRELYEGHGFRVFTRAYSQYFDTYNSVSNQLNFASRTIDHAWLDQAGEPWNLERNAFFAKLTAQGYVVRIYQSDYINYCEAEGVEPEFCLTYRGNSIGAISDTDLPTLQKARFIADSYLHRSAFVHRAKTLLNAIARLGVPLPGWHEGVPRVGPLAATATLDRLQADLLAAPQGRLFFAHLMTPHYPYVYDTACNIKKDLSQWLERHNDRLSLAAPGANSEASRRLRYEAYLVQVDCLLERIDTFFDKLDSTGLMQRATLIVQGDHGSRINRLDPVAGSVNSLEARDYVDGFATLFAARGPGIEPGSDDRPITLVRAFSRVLEHDETAIETDDLLLVDDETDALTAIPMPWSQ